VHYGRSAIALLVAILGTAHAAERVEHLQLGYDAYYRILRVASARSDSTLEPHGYRLDVTFQTEGVVGVLFPWTVHAESRGEIANAGLRPVVHRGERTHRGDAWRVAMTYGDGGPPAVQLDDPPVRGDERDPVPVELRVGTVDPLTASLAMLRAVGAGRDCTVTQQVFDGRLRYDVSYEDLGMTELEPSRHRAYTGPARLCRSTMDPIAGFDQAARQDWRRVVTRTWIAPPVTGAAPVPVQIEMSGKAGTILFYLRTATLVP
jgi:Protein of unknown function (DUF3108)